MATVSDLIKRSLRLIGVIASGEAPTASESQDSLESLNAMIKSWSTQSLVLFKLTRECFELIPDKDIYTFGTTGDFVTSRPMQVLGAAVGPLTKIPIYETPEPTVEDPDPAPVLVGYEYKVDFEIPIEVIEYQKWMGITLKQTPSSLPTKLYLFGSEPLESVQLWPVPNETKGIVIYAKKELSTFANITDEVVLPHGYEDAIVYNLAKRLAPEFGRPLDPDVRADADNYLGNIKRQNNKTILMTSDAFGVAPQKRFNILTGQ